MADSKKKEPLSKKKKDQKTYLYAGGGAVLVVLIYYLYKKHQANTSSSSSGTAGTDPLTGNPYQAGVGSLASSALGTTGTNDPLTGQPYQTGIGSLASLAVDPTTEQTYASEITSLESQLGGGTSSATTTTTNSPISIPAGSYLDSAGNIINAVTGQVESTGNTGSNLPVAGSYVGSDGVSLSASALANELATIRGTSHISQGDVGGVGTVNSTPVASTPAASKTLAQWTTAATSQLVSFGVAPADAAKALSQYLSGKAITNAHAAQGISNITSPGNALGRPPTSGPAPTVRVAKQTTAPSAFKVPVQTKGR